jgi:hypothetical protein
MEHLCEWRVPIFKSGMDLQFEACGKPARFIIDRDSDVPLYACAYHYDFYMRFNENMSNMYDGLPESRY